MSYNHTRDVLRGFYRGNIDDAESTHALEDYIEKEYGRVGITVGSAKTAAQQYLNMYKDLRMLKYDYNTAWEECADSITDQVKKHYFQISLEERIPAAKATKEFWAMKGKCSHGFDSFADMANALPVHHGRGNLFEEDMRARISQDRSRANIRIVEPLRRGGSRQHFERPARPERPARSYHTEEREPARESSANTSTAYTSTSNSGRPSARGARGAKDLPKDGYYRSQSYSTYESVPQSAYANPGPPPARPSYYHAAPRNPQPSNYHHAPPPPRRSYSEHSSRYGPPPQQQQPSSAQTQVNLYSILGISPSASKADILKAWKACSLKHHPDKCTNEADRPKATQKIQQINGAKDVLVNEKMRAEYDRTGRIPSSLG